MTEETSPTPATTPLDESALQAAIDASGHTAELGMADTYLPRKAMIRALTAYLSALPVPPVARSGEVVAWQVVGADGVPDGRRIYDDEMWAWEQCVNRGETLRPLYASPAPSVPWTDAELERVWRETKSPLNPADFLRACLRALGAGQGAVPEDVEAAIDAYKEAVMEAYDSATHDNDTEYNRKANVADAARAALLALYRPAGESRDV